MLLKPTNTLIVGASISGLASAASLQNRNIEYIIIEKQNQIAAPWRNHYDRLHLHTSKRFSCLPYKKFARGIPRYPDKQQVIEYLEDYQKMFNINPCFDTEAVSARREEEYWVTKTNHGSFKSKYLIIATGAYANPKPIQFKGIATFSGTIRHSCEYKTGLDFKGQNVLVVGFGNSACEIAIDLYELGSKVSMAVRSPVNVIPRDILGLSVLELSVLMSHLPPRIADIISAPLINWMMGDLTKLGLKSLPYGPLEQIRKDGRVPLLDIGTIQHIREGHIKIHSDIDFIAGETVYFKDGKKETFDVIIAGIGYEPNYTEFIDLDSNRIMDLRLPVEKQKYFGKGGLYFCGYRISPTGQIREISSNAQKIAKDIAHKESGHNG
jgi:indole-3-pyruvate monooxygenase